MTIPPHLAEILDQTLCILSARPTSIARKVRLLAGDEDLDVSDEDLDLLQSELISEDANNLFRFEFHRRISLWDHVVDASWTGGTKPHTLERRARVHELLGWSPRHVERCNWLFPGFVLRNPIIITVMHDLLSHNH